MALPLKSPFPLCSIFKTHPETQPLGQGLKAHPPEVLPLKAPPLSGEKFKGWFPRSYFTPSFVAQPTKPLPSASSGPGSHSLPAALGSDPGPGDALISGWIPWTGRDATVGFWALVPIVRNAGCSFPTRVAFWECLFVPPQCCGGSAARHMGCSCPC